MAAHLYMSKSRWIAGGILLASVGLFYWSIGVRLAGGAEVEALAMRQEALQFKITNLRWQRDALDTEESEKTRAAALLRLIEEPDGLPDLVDQLQDMAQQYGIDIRVAVSEPESFESMDGVFTRQLELSFDGVPYDLLETYVGHLQGQASRWHFLLGGFNLTNRGSEASVAGKMQMQIWTGTGKSVEQDALF